MCAVVSEGDCLGVQPQRVRAYFGEGVIANFEKEMREIMTTPRIEEVPDEVGSNAGEGDTDRADEEEEREEKDATNSSPAISKEVKGAKKRNRSSLTVSEEHLLRPLTNQRTLRLLMWELERSALEGMRIMDRMNL